MLQITNDKALSIQAIENKRNKAASASVGGGGIGSGVNKSIENLLTVINLTKKSKLTKLKKVRLSNIKANFKTDFLTPKAKKAFIHLQKAFTKALILRHFDSERHIWIKIDALGYAIGAVLS